MDIKHGLIVFLKSEILEDTSIEINGEDQLLSSGLVDSLGLMRIVRYIEKHSGITVPFEDITLENFMSVDSIVTYVNNISN
ncbi:acyl carrier protein [Algibacter sp. 2305UL17-15]|uniref:acyl carrier protein n=1 Tax=Algibacter sp. 2305UL17-15 TaxID=3231268 RepID=UPI003457DB1C